jgi:hypothetical protein
MAEKLKMLRLDGEIWEIAPEFDTDENSVSCRPVNSPHDDKAIKAGITHVQTSYGGMAHHEVRRLA